MAKYIPDISELSTQISPDALFDAMHEFDAKNNTRPHREIAQEIAGRFGFDDIHPIVDEISHALEDAFDIGQRRPQVTHG